MAGDEQLTNQRAAERFGFQCEVSATTGHQFFTGFSENISVGGLFISTYQIQPIGSRFEVSFTVPGVEHEFAGSCVVRWVREYNEDQPQMTPGMGVSFDNLSEQDVQILDAILKRVETIFYDD
jgi:uncharacterized protein (TIGR02266 family)